MRRIPRPMPEPPDRDHWLKQREAFIPKLVELLNDEQVAVFLEMKQVSRETQAYYGGHVRQNIVGVVNPRSDQLVSLIVPHCDTEVFQAFLDTVAKETEAQKQEARRVCLVLDNASWHQTKRLIWHHIQPIYLPP